MASGGEAVAENALYYQNLVFFSTFLWHDLWTWISAVHCASSHYIAVATIRIELSEHRVFDKKKEKKKKKKQFAFFFYSRVLYLNDGFSARWGSRFLRHQ